MKVLLGMSGGVDSTYAALELKKRGCTVEGAVLKMHEYTEVEAAKSAAESVGVPIRVLDCRASFRENVQADFVREYSAGRTPNPCVICNSTVKFYELAKYARENGFDAIATGHYASVGYENGRYFIRRGEDAGKDQSYVLWRLTQDVLSMLMFPLGETTKNDVKRQAHELGLAAAERGESQEICFLPDGNYPAFIEEQTGKKAEPGNFTDESGNVLGRHAGITHYTVGQRKGLGIALGKRMFVAQIRPQENIVVLSDDPNRTERRVRVENMVFSGMEEPQAGAQIRLSVKVRYLAPLTEGVLRYFGEGKGEILLDTPVRAVTPGQSAVCYRNGGVMCGGIIVGADKI